MNKRIGRYELLAELGRGGFGHVYRALDPIVGRLVAVKVLVADGDAGMLTRFRNEAAASGRLRHANIVTIFDFGEQDASPYIVMELLEGRDLQHAIEERTPLSLLEKIQIMADIASGLSHAHSRGIIHRDVKPANVMVLNDRSVKIMDFGIAFVTQATESRLTPRGSMIGTFRYMAPEQFRGAEPDQRSDIFAYGLIFYELLTGIHPFHAPDAAALMYNILSVAPVPVQDLCPNLPQELHIIVARLLNKDPDGRYNGLDDVLFDLEPVMLALRKSRAGELLAAAESAQAAGNLEEAHTAVRQALELAPGHEQGRSLRAHIQRALRRQTLRPRIEELLQQGSEALRAANPGQAVELFESAVRLDATDEAARHRLKEARAALDRAREADRLVAQARDAAVAGDHAGAVRLARHALELAPGSMDAVQVLKESEDILAEQKRNTQLKEDLARARRLLDIHSWDEALGHLAELAREFPDRAEIGALVHEARHGKTEDERQRFLALGLGTAREEFRQGKVVPALARLQSLAEHFPESKEVESTLEAVRSEMDAMRRREIVQRALESSRAAAEHLDFEAGLRVLDVALGRYPSDPDLQRERLTIAAEQREAARRAKADLAIAQALQLRSTGQLQRAVAELDAYLAGDPSDLSIATLRDEIQGDLEAAERSAELRAFVLRASEHLSKGEPEVATNMLARAPQHLAADPEITKLRAAAEAALERRAEESRAREEAVQEALRAASKLSSEERFPEAFAALDAFERRYGTEPRSADMRRQTKLRAEEVELARRRAEEARRRQLLEEAEAERLELARRESEQRLRIEEQARAEAAKERNDADLLASHARALLPHDPGGAIEILSAARESLRRRPEVEALRVLAVRAMEEQDFRQRIAQLMEQANALGSGKDFTGAIRLLDEGMQRYPRQASLQEVRNRWAKAQAAQIRQEFHREVAATVDPLLAAKRYAEAELAIAGALVRDPSDEVLQQLRIDVEAKKAEWEREQEAQRLQDAIRAAGNREPAAAVAEWESLAAANPGHPEIAAGLETARKTLASLQLKNLIEEADRLCSQEEYDAALAKLASAGPDLHGDLSSARQRIGTLREESEARRAAQAASAALGLRQSDPRSAVRSLESLPPHLRQRPEVRKALEECRRAVVELERSEAIAHADELCKQGKLGKARAQHQQALKRFGNSPALEAVAARIEQAAKPSPPAAVPHAPEPVAQPVLPSPPPPAADVPAPDVRQAQSVASMAIAGASVLVLGLLSWFWYNLGPGEIPQAKGTAEIEQPAAGPTIPKGGSATAPPSAVPQGPASAPKGIPGKGTVASGGAVPAPLPEPGVSNPPAPRGKQFQPPVQPPVIVATAPIQVPDPIAPGGGGLPQGGAPSIPITAPPAAAVTPAVQPPSSDIAAIQKSVADFASAFSAKNYEGVIALWPSLPNRNGIRDAFRNRDYSVTYSLEPSGAPAIQGDRAQIAARRTVTAVLQPNNKRDQQGPTGVTVSLQKQGERWVIAEIK